MNLSQSDVLKLITIAALFAFILLLVSFQFIFAFIVLIVAVVSYFLSRQNQGS